MNINFRNKGLCIVMDPPFGGRVEPLIHTIRELSDTYNKLCERENKLLPVIWAFPYFAEPYITNMEPEIKMHDYRVSIYIYFYLIVYLFLNWPVNNLV